VTRTRRVPGDGAAKLSKNAHRLLGASASSPLVYGGFHSSPLVQGVAAELEFVGSIRTDRSGRAAGLAICATPDEIALGLLLTPTSVRVSWFCH